MPNKVDISTLSRPRAKSTRHERRENTTTKKKRLGGCERSTGFFKNPHRLTGHGIPCSARTTHENSSKLASLNRTESSGQHQELSVGTEYLIEERLQQRLHGPVGQGAPEVGDEPRPEGVEPDLHQQA